MGRTAAEDDVVTGAPATRLGPAALSLPGQGDRRLWLAALAAAAAGLVCWALGAGVVALWLFIAAAVAVALLLPLPLAFVSPLYMGVVGWLVDMLPLVTLAGWLAVCARWAFSLLRERRLPRGGRWTWIPIALVAWTALGIVSIDLADFKHFLLLLGIQVLISCTILALADKMDDLRDRTALLAGLLAFVVLMSVGVFLQWVGVPVESLQDDTVSERVEEAYGVDAFPNNVGMVKYARAVNAGSYELRKDVARLGKDEALLPPFDVFPAKFHSYRNVLLVVFEGSARPFEDQLMARGVELVYDNVGMAPANTVPRLRSFPRNPLTYAGVCAALFPLAFFLAWSERGRRRLLGIVAIAACLFGAGFSLARGAWVAIAIGGVYLLIDGVLGWRNKLQYLGAFVAGAAVLTGLFFFKYDSDPLTARAGGQGSINTREALYEDTVDLVGGSGANFLIGFGTEKARGANGSSKEFGAFGQYVPKAGTHSTYLNYLFRTGVPGALAVAALYLIAALHARAAARERDRPESWLATLLAASIVLVAAHALILSLYVEPVYTLTISLVVGLAMATARGLSGSVLPWRTGARA